MEPTVAQIREMLGVLVFGEEDDELEHAVVRLLERAAANASPWPNGRPTGLCRSGWPRRRGGSDCFRGGIVVRDAAMLESTARHAATRRAPRTAETAAAMARAVREQTGADFGLGIAAFPPLASQFPPPTATPTPST